MLVELQVVEAEPGVLALPPHYARRSPSGDPPQPAEVAFDVRQLRGGRVAPYVADGVDLPEGGVGGLSDVPLAVFAVGVVGAHENGAGVGGESEEQEQEGAIDGDPLRL